MSKFSSKWWWENIVRHVIWLGIASICISMSDPTSYWWCGRIFVCFHLLMWSIGNMWSIILFVFVHRSVVFDSFIGNCFYNAVLMFLLDYFASMLYQLLLEEANFSFLLLGAPFTSSLTAQVQDTDVFILICPGTKWWIFGYL